MLFTTKTCPNCKVAASILEKAGMEYMKVDAEEETNMTRDLGIKQAPTLVVSVNGNVEKYSGPSAIRGYINSIAKNQ